MSEVFFKKENKFDKENRLLLRFISLNLFRESNSRNKDILAFNFIDQKEETVYSFYSQFDGLSKVLGDLLMSNYFFNHNSISRELTSLSLEYSVFFDFTKFSSYSYEPLFSSKDYKKDIDNIKNLSLSTIDYYCTRNTRNVFEKNTRVFGKFYNLEKGNKESFREIEKEIFCLINELILFYINKLQSTNISASNSYELEKLYERNSFALKYLSYLKVISRGDMSSINSELVENLLKQQKKRLKNIGRKLTIDG